MSEIIDIIEEGTRQKIDLLASAVAESDSAHHQRCEELDAIIAANPDKPLAEILREREMALMPAA